MDIVTTQRISARMSKRVMLGTLSATPLMLAILASSAGSAFAQAAPTPQNVQAAQAAPTEEIVVTGTRIIRNGYEAPTPVTVVGVEQLQSIATSNVADYLNTLPELAGSATPQSTAATINAG